jgi:Lon protease-like protein
MELPPGSNAQQAPSNSLLTTWVSGLFEEDIASRIEMEQLNTVDGDMELDTPLFVCTISFPNMPTFLHIFEPRYRLMIRRVFEDNTRRFGMLLYNPTREAQGDLGPVAFYEYGTLLSVVNMQLLPDGRSLLETVGVSRFRVLRHSMLDGYTVGKIERVNDISITEEEAIEAAETSKEAMSQEVIEFSPHAASSSERPDSAASQDLDSLSTQKLLEKGTTFIKKMQEQSVPWLHSRVVNAYGDCPNDAALFPWWFASVIPASNAEKYRMLLTSSVRERLKLCVEWTVQLEAQ